MIVGVGAADMNDAGTLEILDEDADDSLARFVIQRIESLVDEHPARRVQQYSRECEGLLLVLAQFPIPALGRIQQGNQPLQLESNQRFRIRVRLKGLRGR